MCPRHTCTPRSIQTNQRVAIAAHGEQIKINSAQYLWICRGVKRPLLPDTLVAQGPPDAATPHSPNDPTT
jgi:hypothetical protein